MDNIVRSQELRQISMEYLQSILNYDQFTGIWTRKGDGNKRWPAGEKAGRVDSRGYLQISVNGKRHLAHRLAFIFMGVLLPDEVDHIDGDRLNNAWHNLRPATRRQNIANSKNFGKYKKGVRMRGYNRYQARIIIDGKSISLGTFSSEDMAHDAYMSAAKKYFADFICDGSRA